MNAATSTINPLLAALPPEMSRVEIAHWLEQPPSAAVPTSSLVRTWLAGIFVVTRESLEICRAILAAMRQAAHMQDPRSIHNRVRAIQVEETLAKAPNAISNAATANGLCILGITGVGKSHLVKRVLSRIPQVVVHDGNVECEMLELRQLVHLTVHLSGDGSPFAFFVAALSEMDSLLGTEYLKEGLRLRSGARALMVFFMKKVVLHRVLFIAIEEAQQSNMDFSRYAGNFQSMFLQLLNFCVPICVIGNPGGIAPLFKNAQVRRRLTAAGLFRLEPAFAPTQTLWQDDYVPGIWGRSPLVADDEDWGHADTLAATLWQMTGGFPSHLAQLRCEAIREAIDSGAPRVERKHVEAAYRSAQYSGSRLLAEIFVARDAGRLLESFTDIDSSHYAWCWAALKKGSGERSSGAPEPVDGSDKAESVPVPPMGDEKGSGAPPSRKTGRKQKTTAARSAESRDSFSDQDVRSVGWASKQPVAIDE